MINLANDLDRLIFALSIDKTKHDNNFSSFMTITNWITISKTSRVHQLPRKRIVFQINNIFKM